MVMKEYFKNNKEAFDCEQLPENHFNDFMDKLNKSNKHKHTLRWWAVAAVVCLLIVSGIVVNKEFQEIDVNYVPVQFVDVCHTDLTNSVTPALFRANSYYDNRISDIYKDCFMKIPITNMIERYKYAMTIRKYYADRCDLYNRLENDPNNPYLHAALIKQYQVVEEKQSILSSMLNHK